MPRERDWEDPEIMDWENDSQRSTDDRCFPAIALVTAVGAVAFCRPRYYYGYGCRPRYYYGYGCRPSYFYGYGGYWDYGFRTCHPRPCRPV